VNVEKSLSLFSHRRRDDRSDDDDVRRRARATETVGESQRPRLGGSFRRRVGGVRVSRGLRLPRGDDDEAAAARLHERGREGLGRVLQRADEEIVQRIPVLERRLLDGCAALPAADDVHEPVHPSEAGDDAVHPCTRRRGIEEVDCGGVRLDAELACQRVERLLLASAEREADSLLGEDTNDARAETAPGARDRDHAFRRHARSLRSRGGLVDRMASFRQSS
jgi:hypothetical protein